MYNIRPTTKFQKDLKRVKKRGFDIPLLTDIIKKLAAGEPLPEKDRDHQLAGDLSLIHIWTMRGVVSAT